VLGLCQVNCVVHPASVIPDRGPLPYFRGRKEILKTFTDYLDHYKKEGTGTTFLIQGAPGAGKTALLDVLSSRAKENHWDVAEIKVKDLHNPVSMAQSLGESYVIDKQYEASVGIHGLGGGYTRNVAGYSSVERLLKDVSPKNGLVLMLDEAQTLNFLKETPDAKILAFVKNCTVQLGALDKKSEREVIHEWLIKEGDAKGNIKVWIDAIAEQVHGWPQHIISYIEPAIESITSNNHQMTDEGLEYVLEKGVELRVQYYEQRAQGFSNQQRQIIASLIAILQRDGYLEIEDVMESVTPRYGKEKAEKFFNDLLHSGILHKQDGGVYRIPIPSMQTWLLNEYGAERIEIPREDARAKVKRQSRDDENGLSKWSQER